MSFLSVILEYKWVILFYSSLLLIIYLNRKRLTNDGPLMYLLKTKIGLSLMDKTSRKYNLVVRIFGIIGIFAGYLGFVFVSYTLLKTSYNIIIEKAGTVGASPVIPGLPIAGTGLVFPLLIGWICLFIIMIVHEFSHGVVARAYNVKIKSSGIAFFGPILGAFVEPDEKQLSKQKFSVHHSIIAAGPFSNLVLGLICSILLIGIVPAFHLYSGNQNPNSNTGVFYFGLNNIIADASFSSGVKISTMQNETFPAFNAGMPEFTVIKAIDQKKIRNISDLEAILLNAKPGQSIFIETENSTYNITLTKNPENETKAYLGIYILGDNRIAKPGMQIIYPVFVWLFELLFWTAFISINIGLINLFPIFITDGAQILRKDFEIIFKKRKDKGIRFWKMVNLFCLLIILILLFLPLLRNLSHMISAFFLSAFGIIK